MFELLVWIEWALQTDAAHPESRVFLGNNDFS